MTDPKTWALVFLTWIIGGVLGIILIAQEERRKRGGRGKLFACILENFEENPIPATIGYGGKFVFGWLVVLTIITTTTIMKK